MIGDRFFPIRDHLKATFYTFPRRGTRRRSGPRQRLGVSAAEAPTASLTSVTRPPRANGSQQGAAPPRESRRRVPDLRPRQRRHERRNLPLQPPRIRRHEIQQLPREHRIDALPIPRRHPKSSDYSCVRSERGRSARHIRTPAPGARFRRSRRAQAPYGRRRPRPAWHTGRPPRRRACRDGRCGRGRSRRRAGAPRRSRGR
jgi:hypothetical protein